MIIVLLVVLAVALTNYEPNTILSGWDTIHSEFNVWLELKRTVFSAWQEYRGLGLVDGMGHGADLVRQLVMMPLMLMLPMNMFRYVQMMVLLGVGSVGAYWWLSRGLLKRYNSVTRYVAATLGGLVYLLNLGTVSNFYVPLESFSSFWAILPWSLWSWFEYLDSGSRKDLIRYGWISVLMTPAFYIPTIFVVYGLLLGVMGLVHLMVVRRVGAGWRLVKSGAVMALVNAYWLLPFGYFIMTASHYPREAQINLMSSENTFLENQRRGSWEDLVLLRGYYFDTQEGDRFMMQPWREWLGGPEMLWMAYGLVAIAALGLVAKSKDRWAVGAGLVGVGAVLLTNTHPFSNFFSWLAEISPFWAQVFRSPYTKFVVPLALLRAMMVGLGAGVLVEVLKRGRMAWMGWIISVGIGVGVVYGMWPVFGGGLFYERIKVEIPDEYQRLFDFFGEQAESGRIVVLPQYTYWGWGFYNFDYTGSGFIWWGLPQAVMDRAFDVWNGGNENFYWELQRAIYSDDYYRLIGVLRKYRVEWVVVDENIVSYYPQDEVLGLGKVKQLLEGERFNLIEEMGSLKVYRVGDEAVRNSWLGMGGDLVRVGPVFKWGDGDVAYDRLGDYVGEVRGEVDVYYPFRSIFTSKSGVGLDDVVELKEGKLSWKSRLVDLGVGARFVLRGYEQEWVESGLEIRFDGKLVEKDGASTVLSWMLDPGEAEVLVEYPSDQVMVERVVPGNDLIGEKNDCVIEDDGEFDQTVDQVGGRWGFVLSSRDTHLCKDFVFPELEHSESYLIRFEAENLEGKKMVVKVVNPRLGRVDVEREVMDGTNWLVVPPGDSESGYKLSFDNYSIGENVSTNWLGEIQIWRLPYQLLTETVGVSGTGLSRVARAEQVRGVDGVWHPASFLYSVSESEVKGRYLVLWQSFDRGWLVLKVRGVYPYLELLEERVLVNNWANGWELIEGEGKGRIYLVFWPQVLGLMGLLVVVGLGVWSVKRVFFR